MAKAKKVVLVSRDSLQDMLDKATFEKQQVIIGRALVALFNRQTTDEKASNTTKKDNSVGFTNADANSGSITAKSYLKNKALLTWQVDRWLRRGLTGYSRLTKYHKQLNDVAVEKAKHVLPKVQQPSFKGWTQVEIDFFHHERNAEHGHASKQV